MPEDDAVQFPDGAIKRNSTRPLKLRVKCSGVSLGPDLTPPPEIISLTEATAGPIDIKLLYEDKTRDIHDRKLYRAGGESATRGFGRFAWAAGNSTTIDGNGVRPGNPPNVNAPFFRWSGDDSLWIFNMRTSELAPGTYTLKIRIANVKDYVTGFVIRYGTGKGVACSDGPPGGTAGGPSFFVVAGAPFRPIIGVVRRPPLG